MDGFDVKHIMVIRHKAVEVKGSLMHLNARVWARGQSKKPSVVTQVKFYVVFLAG